MRGTKQVRPPFYAYSTISGQRMFPVRELKAHEPISEVSVQGNKLVVKWENGHVSAFGGEFLYKHAPVSAKEAAEQSRQLRPARATELPSVSYGAIVTDKSEKAEYEWLTHLIEAGMCLVRGAPAEPDAVVKLAEHAGGVQKTVYGTTFDVISTPNPINIAYSPVPLEMLHCLRFDDHVVGGESTLADAIAAAEDLRTKNPDAFEALSTIPANFKKIHYKRALPVHLTSRRTIIQLNRHGEIVGVTWAPPFEAPLKGVSLGEMERFYSAYVEFNKILDDTTLRFRLRKGSGQSCNMLTQGDILTFSNRRMVHGREGFVLPPDGERHLVGTYVNIDEFRSRYRVLCAKYTGNADAPTKRVGNGDLE